MAETRASFKIGVNAKIGILCVGHRNELDLGSTDGQHPSMRNQSRPAMSPGAEQLSSPDLEVYGTVGIMQTVATTEISDEVQMRAIHEAFRSPSLKDESRPLPAALPHGGCATGAAPLMNSERHATSPVVTLNTPSPSPAPLPEVSLQRRQESEEASMSAAPVTMYSPVADTADPNDSPVIVFPNKVRRSTSHC